MPDYTVRLIGAEDHRVRLSGPLLADIFATLSRGSRGAVRLRLDGRSFAGGTPPAWLSRASLFELEGIDAERSLLFLSAQPLSEALPRGTPHHDLIMDDDLPKTGLTLMTESLQDALRQEEQSDTYDAGLLRAFGDGFKHVFNHGLVGLQVSNGAAGSPFIDLAPESVETFEALEPASHEPQFVRLAGTLDTIRNSDRAFVLSLASGAKVRGILADPAQPLARFFGKEAVISGQALFRPSGALARIEAARIDPANDADMRIWTTMPRPLEMRYRQRDATDEPQGPRSGVNAMFGQWPRTLTDQEHSAALDFLANAP